MSLASCACAARTDQAGRVLSQLREDLIVTLTVAPAVAVGDETSLRFRVRNAGRRAVDACVGPSRSVWITPEDDTQGNEPLGASAHVVEHPQCQHRFRLSPGAQFEWSETTKVPGIVRGFASLAVDVQFVDPRHCDRSTGCPGVILTASAPIEIR